jgi:H+/Cl- antiporter ClcA
LVLIALVVGAGAGLWSVGFRWLIFAFTWLATGHQQFGQQGRVASLHMPWLGPWFLLAVPVAGGLVYGPLIQRFAPPFFSGVPHDLSVSHAYTYLLVAVLGLAAGLVGYGFKTFLYKLEDVVDELWKGRPEWARPVDGAPTGGPDPGRRFGTPPASADAN